MSDYIPPRHEWNQGPGKGDIPRPCQVSDDEVAENWKRIFGSVEGTLRKNKRPECPPGCRRITEQVNHGYCRWCKEEGFGMNCTCNGTCDGTCETTESQ